MAVFAQASQSHSLADASLEDLMNIEVTSVSRKEQKLSKVAAAVYVIDQEDIRRSGSTNIPDLLRMAPGVDVAQIDANTWAISIRGFNDRYANKVLVLVDGRTVYTPTTSGVNWDQMDVPLEDIDRIEITRGPGGTVWGANAVNGVINIISKSADVTEGAVVSAGRGSQGTAQGLAQYGGQIGRTGTYRVFGDYSNQGNLTASDGRSSAADGWHMSHGGFRSDWKLSPSDSLTVQGDFSQTDEGQTINIVFANHTAGYNETYVPLSRTNNLFSAFIQDEIALTRSLWFTLGSKFEHNAYTGFEYEPSAKLLWQPTRRQTVWVSASRAVVQTSRNEANVQVDLAISPTAGGGFAVQEGLGDPNSVAKSMYDFEAGYRAQVTTRFSLDIATFSSSYRNLLDVVAAAPYFTLDPGPPHMVLPYIFADGSSAHTYGAEAFGTWTVSRRWRITPSLSAIHLVSSTANGGLGVPESLDNTPQFQTQIHSSLDLTKHLDWDVSAWHVGRLRDGGDGAVPAYNRLDTRLAWRIGESAEVSVVGQNLLTPLPAEFHNELDLRRTLVERSIFGRITWRF
jgi:iron complex outermembrane receptor protein